MSVLTLRDELVTRIGAIDGVRKAVPYDQSWDLDELVRVGATQTPCALITCLGMPGADVDRGPNGTFRWVALVMARPGDVNFDQLEADSLKSPGDVAMLLSTRIVRELLEDEFGEGCGRPEKIQAKNFSDAKKARKDVAAWLVTWEQDAAIDDNVALELVELETIVADHDVTGDGESNVQTAAGGPYEMEEDGETPVLDENGEKVRQESVD
ncbi:MAG: hypothetical protein JJ863_21385 [Deltaproteobacteria bacterium]|nr:hypothetical protein [Deltaproteobacteria bacterium]